MRSCNKKPNVFEGSVKSAHRPFFYQTYFCIFLASQKGNAVHCILIQNHNWILRDVCIWTMLIVYKEVFQIFLEMTGKMLTAWWLSMEPLQPFLKSGVLSASLKISRNLPRFIDSLKNREMYSEKISTFSFNVLTGISVLWVDFQMPEAVFLGVFLKKMFFKIS